MVLDLASSPFVDLGFYRASNADLANLDSAALQQHLQTYGLDEGRAFSTTIDLDFYQTSYADLANFSDRQLLEHLQNFGIAEGRYFSPFIDLNLYKSSNADLANMSYDELLGHLEVYGLAEGRNFSQVFDPNFYRASYQDLATAGLDNRQLYQHFQIHGLQEKRAASARFDVQYYLGSNADLVSAGFKPREALQHFVQHGMREGRSGSAIALPTPTDNTLSTPTDLNPPPANPSPPTTPTDLNPPPANPSPPTTPTDLNPPPANPSPPTTPTDLNPPPANPSPPTTPTEEPPPVNPEPPSTPAEEPPPVNPEPPSTPVEEPPPANLIPTQPLALSPTRITPNDLPAPFASASASKPSQVVPVPENPLLNVPEGFTVNVFAENLNGSRWLADTPTGDVLVTETPENRIRLLRDTNGDGAADVSQVFAGPENGLNSPFGMAFGSGYFFVGNTDSVLRFPYANGQEQVSGTGEKIADLPAGGHWTRNLALSPDGQKLYVSIGSQSNVEEEPLPRASVQVMNLDGSEQKTFASGLRNPVGLDFHPVTGELYTTVNERDGLGDDLVPDYLAGLSQDDFYGWPYAYMTSDRLDPRRVENGQSQRPDLAALTQTPEVLFQAHSAPLGLQFYDGQTFPQTYANGAFVAFHGSWNRDRGTGYKVVFAPFDSAGRSQGYYQDFLTGFLLDPAGPTTWGRPTGLQVHSDGSLLLTDDANGRIYRIQYSG